MQRKVIAGGRVWVEGNLVPVCISIEGEHICQVELGARPDCAPGAPRDARIIDARGAVLAPGYVDIHVHGGAGYDAMDATPQALIGMSRFFASHGVTSFLPTTVTASLEATLAVIRAVAEFQPNPTDGARALGVHLEGPYISRSSLGAQNPRFVRDPSLADYASLFAYDNILLLSLAPEIPGAQELIAHARERGAAVAVGHSIATYDQVMEAVSWGVTGASHTYNAMQGLHHREPGTAGAALVCDDIYAQVIVDLVHVHPAMVDLLVRAKGLDKAVLITDAMRAAGMPEGAYELGGQKVIVAKSQARLESGNLAGSTLTMDRAVRNAMQAAHLEPADAIRLATANPAMAVGLGHRKGSLAPGYDADIIFLDDELHVLRTMVMGEVVFEA